LLPAHLATLELVPFAFDVVEAETQEKKGWVREKEESQRFVTSSEGREKEKRTQSAFPVLALRS
jgi:hypothetical protein